MIHKPERNEGDFDGYWVFKKSGDLFPQNRWESVIKLTAGEWAYAIEDVETSMQYAVTVRGFVLPNKFSKMADPLVFETMNPGVSPLHSPPVYSYALSSTPRLTNPHPPPST